jgi:abequosyltransferase
MLDNIRSGHDIFICGFTLCTPDMRPFMEAPIMRTTSDAEFALGEEQGRRAYFALAQTTPAFFSFAGSLIFKKARWDSMPLDEAFVGSCWAHAARFFALMPQGLRLKFLADSYLYKRTENDSFMDRGIIRRYALAVDGYHRLADTFFGETSPEAREIRRVVGNEFPPWILLHAKMESQKVERREDLPLLDRVAAATYRDPTLKNRLYRVIYTYTPLPAYRVALGTHRRLKALRRAPEPT